MFILSYLKKKENKVKQDTPEILDDDFIVIHTSDTKEELNNHSNDSTPSLRSRPEQAKGDDVTSLATLTVADVPLSEVAPKATLRVEDDEKVLLALPQQCLLAAGRNGDLLVSQGDEENQLLENIRKVTFCDKIMNTFRSVLLFTKNNIVIH